MGIHVEFNLDLALRNMEECRAGKRLEAECIPDPLLVGEIYPFLKKGQRNYWLEGELPLLETKGRSVLSMPIASIIILEVTHVLIDGELWTKGQYTVIECIDTNDVKFSLSWV